MRVCVQFLKERRSPKTEEMLMEAQSESFDTLLKYRDSDCDDGRMNVPVPHRSPNDVFC